MGLEARLNICPFSCGDVVSYLLECQKNGAAAWLKTDFPEDCTHDDCPDCRRADYMDT